MRLLLYPPGANHLFVGHLGGWLGPYSTPAQHARAAAQPTHTTTTTRLRLPPPTTPVTHLRAKQPPQAPTHMLPIFWWRLQPPTFCLLPSPFVGLLSCLRWRAVTTEAHSFGMRATAQTYANNMHSLNRAAGRQRRHSAFSSYGLPPPPSRWWTVGALSAAPSLPAIVRWLPRAPRRDQYGGFAADLFGRIRLTTM